MVSITAQQEQKMTVAIGLIIPLFALGLNRPTGPQSVALPGCRCFDGAHGYCDGLRLDRLHRPGCWAMDQTPKWWNSIGSLWQIAGNIWELIAFGFDVPVEVLIWKIAGPLKDSNPSFEKPCTWWVPLIRVDSSVHLGSL